MTVIPVFAIKKMADMDVIRESVCRAKNNNPRFITKLQKETFFGLLTLLSSSTGSINKTHYQPYLLKRKFARAFWNNDKDWVFKYRQLCNWPDPLRYLEWCLDPSNPLRYK